MRTLEEWWDDLDALGSSIEELEAEEAPRSLDCQAVRYGLESLKAELPAVGQAARAPLREQQASDRLHDWLARLEHLSGAMSDEE